jgi:hypothetical protein
MSTTAINALFDGQPGRKSDRPSREEMESAVKVMLR